jgi:hypothetical protein
MGVGATVGTAAVGTATGKGVTGGSEATAMGQDHARVSIERWERKVRIGTCSPWWL